jgi:hypothetical protein
VSDVNITRAHAARGSYSPGRGDSTGKRFVAQADEKIKREEALRNTRNALQSEPCVLVSVPGGRAFLIPKEAHREIVAQTEAAEAARHE